MLVPACQRSGQTDPPLATESLASPVSDDLPMAAAADLAVTAPFAGVVVALPRGREERVGAGAPLVVLEAMKMEHEVLAETDGVVGELAVAVGDAVEEGQLLLTLAPGDGTAADARRGARDAERRRARGPAGGRRAPRDRPGRGPPGGGRAPSRARPAHRPREPRRPARRGQLRRVRPAAVRRPGAAPHPRGADRPHPRRRPRRRGRRRRGQSLRGDVLRLHRPGRHAGHAQPPQEGPAVRPRRAAEAARRAVRRGRRRAPGRRRHADRRRP